MLRENKLAYENLSTEIPVVIKNSSMTNVLMCCCVSLILFRMIYQLLNFTYQVVLLPNLASLA